MKIGGCEFNIERKDREGRKKEKKEIRKKSRKITQMKDKRRRQ